MQLKILFILSIFFFGLQIQSQTIVNKNVINFSTVQIKSDYHYLLAEMKSLENKGIAFYHFKESLIYSISKKETLYLHLRLIKEFLKQKLYKIAHQECQLLLQKIKSKQEIVYVYEILAEIYTSLNLLNIAVHQYDIILALNPYHKAAKLNQILLNAELNKGKIDKIKEQTITEPSFYRHMGDIHQIFSNIDKAIYYYKKALILNPDHRFSALKLFQIYSQNNQYDKWIEFSQTHPSQDMFISSLLAQAYLKKGEKEMFLEKATDLLFDHPSVLMFN